MKHRDFESIKPGIEINEHPDAHKQGFKIQRGGIVAILAIVQLAALGLFGDGLLSRRVIGQTSASIDYQRFYRFEAIMELKVELLASGNSNVISFPKSYLKDFEIESITPSTETTNFKGERSEFVFNGPGNGIITFYLVPRKVGSIEGEIFVNNDRFEVNHFIYP